MRKLNAMHFDCSWTLSLVIVAARDNENEQLKCATSNLSTKTAKKGLTQLTLTPINAQVAVITDFILALTHTVISEEAMQCCGELRVH